MKLNTKLIIDAGYSDFELKKKNNFRKKLKFLVAF